MLGQMSPEQLRQVTMGQTAVSAEAGRQATLAQGASEFDRSLNQQRDLTTRGQNMTDARQREAAAKSGGGVQDDSTRNLAMLAARSPEVLQGLTPTLAGNVLAAVSSDPELLAQYDAARLAPLRQRSEAILAALKGLVSDEDGETRLTPGARKIFGELTPVGARSYIPGKEATDANAALQQVLGQQIVDLISDMKAQSRTGATGFGQLSTRELAVLESAATQLTQRLSEPAALRELTALKSSLEKILQDASSRGGAPRADGYQGEVRQAPDGRLLGMVDGNVVELERAAGGYRVKR
jgi:hypothetical protein